MLPPLLGVPGEAPEGQLEGLITSQQMCRDLLFTSCPLHIALALAEMQMCPALARGKWPRLQQASLWGAWRQHRPPRTDRRGEVLSMVLKRKIRAVAEVSYETSLANLLDLKG